MYIRTEELPNNFPIALKALSSTYFPVWFSKLQYETWDEATSLVILQGDKCLYKFFFADRYFKEVQPSYLALHIQVPDNRRAFFAL